MMKHFFILLTLFVTLSSTLDLEYNEVQMIKSKFGNNKSISADHTRKLEKRAVSSSKFSIRTVLNITVFY